MKACRELRGRLHRLYAAFFSARTLAHRARKAAAILLREAADMVLFIEMGFGVLSAADCVCFRTLAHLALCASAIL